MPTKYRNSRNDQLSTYIKTLGEIIPLDFTSFQAGAINYGKCLFCLNESVDNEVRVYNPATKTSYALEVIGCCDTCNNQIVSALGAYYSQKLIPPAANSFRIELFNTKGQVIPGVEAYLKHREYNLKEDFSDKCYFCSSDVRNVPHRTVSIPMDASYVLTGGEIRCCQSCYTKLDFSVFAQPEKFRNSSCVVCKRNYVITIEEQNQRSIEKSTGVHMCPICARQVILNETGFLGLKSKDPPIERYIHLNCEYCWHPFMVDLTIDHDVLKQKHKINVRIACSHCGRYAHNNTFFIYYRSQNLYIEFVTTEINPPKYAYRVCNKDGSTLVNIGYSYPTADEVIMTAIVEVENLLRGDQLKIWPP